MKSLEFSHEQIHRIYCTKNIKLNNSSPRRSKPQKPPVIMLAFPYVPPSAAPPALRPTARVYATPRLTLADQWQKLVTFLSGVIDRTAASNRYHQAAENQIDAAVYALNDIMRDLSEVMTLPPRRPATPVLHLQPMAAPRQRHRLVAA